MVLRLWAIRCKVIAACAVGIHASAKTGEDDNEGLGGREEEAPEAMSSDSRWSVQLLGKNPAYIQPEDETINWSRIKPAPAWTGVERDILGSTRYSDAVLALFVQSYITGTRSLLANG
jgi:hypothetical protein